MEYGCVKSLPSLLQPAPDPNHLLRILPRSFTEVMLRLGNPLRASAPWAFSLSQAKVPWGWGRRGAQSLSDFHREMESLLETVRSRGPPSPDDTLLGSVLYRLLLNG